MTELQERQLLIDLSSAENQLLPGFRLERIEIYNWGTFHGQVHKLNLSGRNGLLTGDIGSGKSTLVDAITTLLVPAHRVAYNKAAGADAKERSLKSYVLGYYRSERNEVGGTAKPVGLRDHNSYSVILGVFRNIGYDNTVTLAQVFWMKDPNTPPNRFYVCAETDLMITIDFSNFGSDISKLKKRLSEKATLWETFPQYSAWFRRRLGIEHEQALELFHQTVSMKSVGNLTDFVRLHMLKEFDAKSKIEELMKHFDNLTRAHDAVLKAAKQAELLTPLVEDCKKHAEYSARKEELRACREALRVYIGTQKKLLLEQKRESLQRAFEHQHAQVEQLEQKVDSLRTDERNLRIQIAENGGSRIEQLAQEIESTAREHDARRKRFDRYVELAATVGLAEPINEEQFVNQKHDFRSRAAQERENDTTLENEFTELGYKLKQKRDEHKDLSDEIKSLKSRQSNIPSEQVGIRARMCEALSVRETEMPFAGELLQVRDEYRDWEGAAERLLRGFGMSVLVPDSLYSTVVEWVDQTNLRGHIVYFRVRKGATDALPNLHAQALAHKISIKDDTVFYDWLERELYHRADVICCESPAEFKRESKAITRAGQIKKPGGKHEKDDRTRIDDRTRFVLGWSNRAKINTLQNKANHMETEIADLAQKISKVQAKREELRQALEAFSKLEEYLEFQQIDWRSLAIKIAKLEKEKRHLEAASDILARLKEQLDAVATALDATDRQAREQRDKRTATELRIADCDKQLVELREVIDDPDNAQHATRFVSLDNMLAEVLSGEKLTADTCDRWEQKSRGWIQNKIDSEEDKLKRLSAKIIEAMAKYNKDYPLETQEVDANIDSAHEYTRMLESLRGDDLPRFQAQFKQLLNENTIREIASFQSQLNKEREDINERIERINESLTKIDYSPDTYIRLEARPTLDADIRDFQQQLRACTENTLTGTDDEQYSEAKFLQVKQILDRFRGREGQTELDRRWTARVTDVRNWYLFAASERRREDNSEYEHYSDSAGKSGGQKEKLAYTILAASLAYQFGIDPYSARAREFRFVVIDEAFGRGSDDSATFGLKLFTSLKLQLLVVTPLQKTNIIEPFVNSVGFVQNDGGNSSKVRNLTIEEYREGRNG